MKPKLLFQALFQIVILALLSPAFSEPLNSPEAAPAVEEPKGEESSEETSSVESPAPAPAPEPLLEAHSEGLIKAIMTELNNTNLDQGKKMQLRAMALAAYRDKGFEALWPEAVHLAAVEKVPAEPEVLGEGPGGIAMETAKAPRPDLTGTVDPAVAEVFASLQSLLAFHEFVETALSFNFTPLVNSPDCPVPPRDIRITLGLAEACLRMKQGPASVAEWPNWTYGDQPVVTSTAGHYNEVTARFGKTAAGLPDPMQVAEDFVPKNWVYQRILQEIQRVEKAPEPPRIEITGLIKIGNEFPQARELAEFLVREGHLAAEKLPEIDGVYVEPLSEGVRSYQKSRSLQSDGILGATTASKISQTNEDDMARLVLNLHRARRLPDNMGDRYLLANLPSAEVYGFESGAESIRMRIVFGKDILGQHTPIFRDKMEEVVFRPYWNVPYSIAVAEGPYSDLSYLGSNGFKIISNSTGTELPLSNESLILVRENKAYIRQDAGGGNALGLVKFLFPNKFSVYFHDTPFKHFFENSYRAQSHGCVRLQEPEAMANWLLKGVEGWDAPIIKSAINEEQRKAVALTENIPVYIVYFTAFPDAQKEQGVGFFRDYYQYDLPDAVVDAPAPKPVPSDLSSGDEKMNPFSIFKRLNPNPGGPASSPRKGKSLLERLLTPQN